MTKNNRFRWELNPIADDANIVKGKKYRFTVLTPSLIRLEYDREGIFEDRASQSFFYRNVKAVNYTLDETLSSIKIETDCLVLDYVKEAEFNADTLIIRLKNEPASSWKFSENFEQLGGTASTLDGINGSIPLGTGVCSRNGFSVIDDSNSMVLDEDGWVNVRRKNTVDAYFFGYGYDYLGAIKDFYRLTGGPVMLPAYALGNWWSRYYKYTQESYICLMEKFKAEQIPFSVAVVDMDWHVVDTPEGVESWSPYCQTGWTGYSWNKNLFPDYKGFLKYLSNNNLHTALNLHPADGCRWHEDMYEEMCSVCGVDPNSKKTIPFDILNPKSMANYFDILLHPYEEAGVDFWWMDWQQGTSYGWIHKPNINGCLQDEREVLNPLWMLNHLHILDIQRNGRRPMYFSRFSGPGSHRYSIGFSGDTHITWESLAFQPYFTATASNIGYCWWSHDIGGHMCGYHDDELITRWVQLGVFSPINRLHSSNDQFSGKEPWNYDTEFARSMKKYLRFRAELFPYLYTMNYRTCHDLEPLIWPMYYTHPKCNSAYEVENQFWFGSELMVAPITQPRDKQDMLGSVEVWFPKGLWFDFFNGTVYHSQKGRKLDIFRYIKDCPVFAKEGAIVVQTVLESNSNIVEASKEMRVTVFPGANNKFTLYEDEGEYYNFENGRYVKTEMTLDYSNQKAIFKINPAVGDKSLIPEVRKWNIELRGYASDINVMVKVDGKPIDSKISRNKKTNTICFVINAPVTSSIAVEANAERLLFDNSDRIDKCYEILQKAKIDYAVKNRLLDIINGQYDTLHAKIEAIYCAIPSLNHLAKAIKEQLVLENDEFYDSVV